MDFILEHQAEEVASAVYTLKDEIRTNLTFTLKPNDKLTVDEYFLRTRMALGEQTAEVKKLFAAKAKRFPPDADPWTWFYVEKPIAVGTEEEGIAENAARCEAFRGFLDRLATNLGELTESLEKVKKGEDCVQNGKLDVEKFTKLVVDWRKKQGEIQKEIGGFPDKEPALWRKAKAAHYQLVQAGQMVSKRSIQLQKEVTDKYSVPVINPDSHPAFSQGSVRGSPTPARLNLSVKEILEKVCPPEEEEAAEPEEAGKAEKAEKSGKSEKSGK
jgi:hypothetical protein